MIKKIKDSIGLSVFTLVLVISIIGVGIYGIQKINELNKGSRELYKDRMIPINQLGSVRYNLLNTLLVSSEVSQNQISFDKAKFIMNSNLDSVQLSFAEYSKTEFTKKEKRNFIETKLLLDKISKTVEKLNGCLDKRDIKTFNVISQKELYPVARSLIIEVNDLIFFQINEGKNIIENSSTEYDASKQKFILLMVIIFAFSAPLFYYLFKKNSDIITSLNYKGKKLVELEKNYRDFINFAGDAILILDPNEKIVDMNESACHLFGYSREELLQKEILDLIFPDETNETGDCKLNAQNCSSIICRKAKQKDGTFLDTEITNWLIEDGEGVFAIIRDITERKKTEALVKDSEEKYRYLFDNNPAHIVIWDFETLKVLEVNNVMLKMHGYDKKEWENMTILDFRNKDDYQKTTDFAALMYDTDEEIFETRGKYLKKNGVEMIMNVSSHRIEYNKRKAILSIAWDITEEVKAENQLKKSEERYHSLIEHAGDAIFVIAKNRNIVEVNSTTCQLLGYSREELLNSNVLDVYPSDSSDYFGIRWDLIKEGKTFLSETKLKRKDGSLVDVEISRKQLDNECYLSIVRDITERKMIEKELVKSKEQLKLFIENSPASLAMFDKDMRYISTSHSWIRDYNLSGRDIIGKSHYDVVPEISQEWKDIHQRCLQGAIEKKEEDFFIREDGKIEWIRWELHPWNLASGEIGGIIMFVDIITERKQATEMFKYQFENAPDIILYVNKKFIIESINREVPGFAFQTTVGLNCIELLPEQSQSFVKEKLAKCFETGENQEFEFELYKNYWSGTRLVPIVTNGEVNHIMIFSTDITSRKQAEQNLLQSEERYRIVIENISDAILLVNENYEIEYMSPAGEKLSGYSSEEVKSKLIFDFIHPDDLEKEHEFFKNAFSIPGISPQKQLRTIIKNGEAIWVEGAIVNLQDTYNKGSYILNFRNITNRRKLEEQQALMASIVNSSDDAIISKNMDGIVTSWNLGAEKILGYTAAEMIQQNIKILIPKSLINEEEKILLEVKAGKSVEHFETKRLKKNGELIDVSLTISPVRDSLGNVVGASKIMRDITESKKTEVELLRYNAELEKANSELDRFVYSASHDLRAPLKSILGLLSITKEYVNPDNEELLECLLMLDSSVFKLDNFIEEILNYSRNARMELDRDVIDFDETLIKIREKYQFIEGIDKLKVHVEINSESIFVADSKRISIIFNNLLSNAFKYKDDAKEESYVKITFTNNSERAIIRLEDNGIGISRTDKEKVFNMFYRATMLSTGSGLGLYIVKEAIDKLEGKITIESELGEGTIFTIEIPNQIKFLDDNLHMISNSCLID